MGKTRKAFLIPDAERAYISQIARRDGKTETAVVLEALSRHCVTDRNWNTFPPEVRAAFAQSPFRKEETQP